ncbi:sigma-E processing peptidase SpoIIGA [Tumebacillus sp. ITR2]|uniref:Sigma-E processing peptidase SpoIIGA n=1 Tax=Tumebacillus amylolyticus TaxID=2801339 RepID=A0ABS1JGV1_9BACL|nr:sigma-E processing peptidase SpoIIGA [Tumebacillus amylolyticus]MBL0389472.1 sigma-E processing peptidase SpoIIGA [Tumebacillus amylolyticus]
MPVVYLDVIWVINLVLDGFILFVTAFLARRKVTGWRMIGASAIGASYALFLFVPALSMLLSFVCKVLFSILMVWVAFRPKGVWEFGKMLGLFYLASFLMGGAAYATNGLFQNISMKNGLVIVKGRVAWLQPSTLILIVVAMPLVYWLGKSAWTRLAKAKHREQNFWDVEVHIGTFHVNFTGLLDTGNALTDPLSRTPVTVLDWELLREVLPSELTESYEKGADPASALGDFELEADWQARMRLVPYRGVGGVMGMLLSFRPDLVRLTARDGSGEVHECRKVLIGLNPKPLAADGSYRAILHPAMLGDEASAESRASMDSTDPPEVAAS